MKKLFSLSVLCLAMMTSRLWAIPSTINYQGTLREKGVPPTGTKQMLFRITDLNGTQVYWSSGNMNVPVVNGLFSAQLTPTGVPWDTITPFIEITVQGQQLSPREPVNATVYAVISSSVVDNAITTTKIADNAVTSVKLLDGSVISSKIPNGTVTAAQLDPTTAGNYLVPAGAIMMFASSCPAGWNVFTGLQGKFPVGADPANPTQFTANQMGGVLSHSHTFTTSTNGAHNHNVAPLVLGSASSGVYPTVYNTVPSPGFAPFFPGEATDSQGAHFHTGTSDLTSSLPPYLTVLFCQKS